MEIKQEEIAQFRTLPINYEFKWYLRILIKKLNQETNDETIKNLIEIIKFISQANLPDSYFIKPLDLVYYEGKLFGYVINQQDLQCNSQLTDVFQMTDKEKILILNKIKKLISVAHQNGIILGNIGFQDIALRTNFNPGFFDKILQQENSVVYTNLENVGIPSKGIRPNNPFLDKYLMNHPLDENVDTFLFNILILAVMLGVSTKNILSEQKSRLINKESLNYLLNDLLRSQDECHKPEDSNNILKMIRKDIKK